MWKMAFSHLRRESDTRAAVHQLSARPPSGDQRCQERELLGLGLGATKEDPLAFKGLMAYQAARAKARAALPSHRTRRRGKSQRRPTTTRLKYTYREAQRKRKEALRSSTGRLCSPAQQISAGRVATAKACLTEMSNERMKGRTTRIGSGTARGKSLRP